MKRLLLPMAAFGAAALLLAGTALAASPMQKNGMQMNSNSDAPAKTVMNWYGGPAYLGAPALKATAALVRAGGGAADFSFPKALVAMLGEKTVHAEVAKLNKQYGEQTVKTWLNGMTTAVNLGLKFATEQGITLPEPPADLTGTKLAAALVKAGVGPDGTFWAGRLFDVAISHDLHNKVMMKINTTAGGHVDLVTHKVLNQAMYDVAHALGMNDVKLASLH
ncbi:MAG: hypothetical protein L0I62_05735 [Gammaproteobacteria bacterium]|nr:hypothetical protein [Gammaproteobacteria bacterium]